MALKTKIKPSKEDVDIGQKLKLCRKLRNISMEELGASVGVSFQQIQKYEKGLNRISAIMLLKLSRVLNISPSELYPDEYLDHKTNSFIASYATDRQIIELIRAWSNIKSPQIKKSIVDFISQIEKTDRL